MTKEEAKRILQNSRKELIDYKGVNNSSAEALYIAIKSLEAWDKVKEELMDKATFDNVDDLMLCMRIIDKHLKEVDS